MKIGLASYECRMNDIDFNLGQIEKALLEAKDADMVCFGEAFSSGIRRRHIGLHHGYSARHITKLPAHGKDPGAVFGIPQSRYGRIYRKGRKDIYSSCALIEDGVMIRNYRRISKNWKDYESTSENYKEGTDTAPF